MHDRIYSINLKTGRATCNGKEFKLDPVGIIQSNLELLCGFRDDGRVPTQGLLDDIAAYEFILKSENPKQMAAEYFEWKEQAIKLKLDSQPRFFQKHRES